VVDFRLTNERFDVEWQGAPKRSVPRRGGRVRVLAPDDRGARHLLQGWLKHAAAERLVPKLMHLADDLNYSVARVAIRCQRTRWGSCRPAGP